MERLEKNEIELKNEQDCWNEIEAVLKKYNCRLEGTATHTDYDYDYEHEIRTSDVEAMSKDYDVRYAQYLEDLRNQSIQRIKDEQKQMFEKLAEFKKFKNLKLIHVGKEDSHYVWFEGLKVDESKVKEPLFFWNGNKFWQYSESHEDSDGVSLIVGYHDNYSHLNGEPCLSFFGWHPGSKIPAHKSVNVKWFKYREDVSIWAYNDMYVICKILDKMIKKGVIYFDEPGKGLKK